MIYAHVMKWPKDQKLVTKKYAGKKVKKIYLLQNGKKLKYSVKGSKVTVKLPKNKLNKADTVIAVQYQ